MHHETFFKHKSTTALVENCLQPTCTVTHMYVVMPLIFSYYAL